MMPRWKWRLTAYYGSWVKDKNSTDIAIQTVHADVVSKEIEIKAFATRNDIGQIDIEYLEP